jgi:tRNA uridine 5-carbamoylmethylation protein Kti12
MRNVFTIIDNLSAGLAELKASLQPLAAFASDGAVRRPQRSRRIKRSGNGRRKASMKTAKAATPKTRKPVSPKVRAMRVQQGKYLAALRQLKPQQRAQVKKAKAEGDYTAALRVAAGLMRKTA